MAADPVREVLPAEYGRQVGDAGARFHLAGKRVWLAEHFFSLVAGNRLRLFVPVYDAPEPVRGEDNVTFWKAISAMWGKVVPGSFVVI